MTKTIIVEFPENFEFPEFYDDDVCYELKCPLYRGDLYELSGDCIVQGNRGKCPFKDSDKTVILFQE